MNRFQEAGQDEQLIEWSSHPLSDVMTALGPPNLQLSPTLHPVGSSRERRLVVSEDQHRVSWAWGAWGKVEVRPIGARSGAPVLTRRARESNVIMWGELSFCDAVELTPYDSRGEAGVTVRRERPMILTSQDVEYRRRGSVLQVRLLCDGQLESLGVRLVGVWGRVDNLVRFDRAHLATVHLNGFHGHVAVVHHREGVERLMHCKAWVPKAREFREVSDEGRDAVRKMLEGEREGAPLTVPAVLHGWLNQWPQRTREALHEIYKAAALLMRPDEIAGHFRQSLPGLFRMLVLLRCDFRGGPPPDLLIAHLNEGTWDDALRRLSPQLPESLSAAVSTAEKEWTIMHALAPGLRDTLAWAGGAGVAALDQALGLVELRARATSLEARLRPESEEGQEIARLLEEIEQAPFRVAPTAPLHGRFDALEQRVGFKEALPLDPDEPPPPSQEGYLRWQAKCRLRRHWRSELARVIVYAEKGEWPPPEDPARESPEFSAPELSRRLSAVETPKVSSLGLSQPADQAEVQSLVQCIKRLLDEREHETSEGLRALARDQLIYVVSPNITLWAPLHRELRRVERQSSQFPWFASQAGLGGAGRGLNARLDSAQSFLEMIEALEQRVRSWKTKGLARDKAKLREVLAAPSHPHFAETYAAARKLLLALAPTAYTERITLPEQPMSPPAGASAEQLRRWWDVLEEVEDVRAKLDSRMSRLQSEAKWFNEQLGGKLKTLLDYWQGRPPGERPDYYTRLGRLQALCAASAEVEPAAFRELVELLDSRADWRRNWERIVHR